MYCNGCGKQIPNDSKFCDACGRVVVGAVPSSSGSSYQRPSDPYRGRLIRPQEGRKIAGVCLAVANYLDVDVTIIRIVWLFMIFGAGTGILAYIIGILAIENEPEYIVEAPQTSSATATPPPPPQAQQTQPQP